MNLIEARKQAHEGWVRSPTRTKGYVRFTSGGHETESGYHFCEGACAEDLDAEDWEPKPKPVEPFEAEVWVHLSGAFGTFTISEKSTQAAEAEGWRKIRVKEVLE